MCQIAFGLVDLCLSLLNAGVGLQFGIRAAAKLRKGGSEAKAQAEAGAEA